MYLNKFFVPIFFFFCFKIMSANWRLETARDFYEKKVPKALSHVVDTALDVMRGYIQTERETVNREYQRLLGLITEEEQALAAEFVEGQALLRQANTLAEHPAILAKEKVLNEGIWRFRALLGYLPDVRRNLQEKLFAKTREDFCNKINMQLQYQQFDYTPIVEQVEQGLEFPPYRPPREKPDTTQDEVMMAAGGVVGGGVGTWAGLSVGATVGTAVCPVVGTLVGALVGISVSAACVGAGWVVSKITSWFKQKSVESDYAQAYAAQLEASQRERQTQIEEARTFMEQNPIHADYVARIAQEYCETTPQFAAVLEPEIKAMEDLLQEMINYHQEKQAELGEYQERLAAFKSGTQAFARRSISQVAKNAHDALKASMRQQENALQFVLHYQRKMARIKGEMDRCFLYGNSVYLPVKECVEYWEKQAEKEAAELEEEFLDTVSHKYPFVIEAKTHFFRTRSLLRDRVEALLTNS